MNKRKTLLAILMLFGFSAFVRPCCLVFASVPEERSESDSLLWWQKTNAYEVYVNSFQDTDGNGYGDIKGVTQRLDHFADLGVGAVWLTPVFVSPMEDNGYDVADYYNINPLYGNNDDMDALLEAAGDHGIRIVMDLVFNHTSDQHQWFQESQKSRDNVYSDWYIWRDAKPDGSAPNNWRSIFGGSAWTWSESRQQYYLHTFAAAQPDLNWENPEVRQALYDIANYWVRKGVGRKSYPQFVYRFPSNTHVSPEKNEKLENREKQREQTFSPAFWIVLAEFILKRCHRHFWVDRPWAICYNKSFPIRCTIQSTR